MKIKIKRQIITMLKEMWRKGNPCALFIREQISTAIMENSVEFPEREREWEEGKKEGREGEREGGRKRRREGGREEGTKELSYDLAIPLLGIKQIN
jgi:hypothetical protein